MAKTTASFGTRRGGLAQSYRSGSTAPRQFHAATAPTRISAPNQQAQSWGLPPLADEAGGLQNISGLSHPVLMRWVSGGIDFFILIVLTFLTMFIFDSLDGGLAAGSGAVLMEDGPLTLAVAMIWFGYGLVFESSSWQGTPGKKLTGLVITDMSGQKIGFGKALGRAFGKIFSTFIPLYIPYIMVGITERKQSLHDKMCGTLVFRRRDLENSSAIFD